MPTSTVMATMPISAVMARIATTSACQVCTWFNLARPIRNNGILLLAWKLRRGKEASVIGKRDNKRLISGGTLAAAAGRSAAPSQKEIGRRVARRKNYSIRAGDPFSGICTYG